MAFLIIRLGHLVLLTWVAAAQAGTPDIGMIELVLRGRRVEGMPLAWSTHEVHLLGRDGQLWQFAPSEAADFRKTSHAFRSYSTSEMRALLLRELGSGYEVSGTSHYLVAHPRGQRSQWAERFEELYRSLVHYFSVRGFQLQAPPYPLVGIVCPNQQEFLRYSAARGLPAGRGVLGSYSVDSNRIVLYDVGGGSGASADWRQNAATVIHEASHQTAFNTGIHSRYAIPPVWVAEGLATMFEAPGVHNSGSYPKASDRINAAQLRQFRELVVPQHHPDLLAELIASDRLFRARPAAAYATAWALTFYLMETDRGRYATYLARTAARPPFEPYTAQQRTADFTAVFGDDWRMLDARLLRFVAGLR